MEFLYEYGLFLVKTITFVVAIGIILALILSAGQKNKSSAEGTIEVSKLNERYNEVKDSLKSIVYDADKLKIEAKEEKQKQKLAKKEKKKSVASKQTTAYKKRLYVLDFDGDIKASAVESFREEITAILSLASPQDEVMVRLESAGGMVHSYGLASSQLARIKDKGIPLTVCVDKVAASGGYMMACVAQKICAAPFAIVGSIGVVAQLPNFHRLLKKNDVDFEMLTAGEYKRTLTMFGENTDKGRQKFVAELETTHELFKSFVSHQRPVVDIDKVATGEIWFGSQAKEQNLIDELITSDDYIMQQLELADIYKIEYSIKKTLAARVGLNIQLGVENAVGNLFSKLNASRFMQ
ncbi:MAG: serine protease SohB [Candidatus Endobugula sp.]